MQNFAVNYNLALEQRVLKTINKYHKGCGKNQVNSLDEFKQEYAFDHVIVKKLRQPLNAFLDLLDYKKFVKSDLYCLALGVDSTAFCIIFQGPQNKLFVLFPYDDHISRMLTVSINLNLQYVVAPFDNYMKVLLDIISTP